MNKNMDYIELELTNGNRIVLENNIDKVYNIHEKYSRHISFTSSFPFFKITKTKYTSFRFRTYYETINSMGDKRYKVNCTLVALVKMFGGAVKEFEQSCIEGEL